MANLQEIRHRIRSVKNIHKITKAMEMVAASKLRRTQERAVQSRLYAQAAKESLASLRKHEASTAHPLLHERAVHGELFIVLTSDRGLAGSYNSNVLKQFVRSLTESKQGNIQYHAAIVVGKKGAAFVSRLAGEVELVGVYEHWPLQPTLSDVRPIIHTAVQMFLEGKIDRVSCITTRFDSISHQQITVQQLLPVEVIQDEEAHEFQQDVLTEPSLMEVIDYVLPRFLEVQVVQAALEAAASEQAMRMIAMKNASDNAKDVTEDLNLLFNRTRQAAITQELAEVIAGAQVVS